MQAFGERVLGLCRHRCHLPRLRLPTCRSCCSTCTKIILVLVNLVFLVCGLVFVVLGVWLHVSQDRLRGSGSGGDGRGQTEAVISLETIPFVLMGLGGFVASMSFLGCCGACAESVCFLGFYSLLTLIIVIAEIIVASLSSEVIDQTSRRLLKMMKHQVENRYNVTAQKTNNTKTDTYKVTVDWDSLQKELHCCGASGPWDYRHSAWFNHTKDFSGVYIPSTCCSLARDGSQTMTNAAAAAGAAEAAAVAGTVGAEEICQVEAMLIGEKRPTPNVYVQGCHEAMTKLFKRYEKIAISLLCIIIIIQIMNFVFACFLMTWVKKKHSDYSWCEKDEFE